MRFHYFSVKMISSRNKFHIFLQGGLSGLAGKFPPIYMGAVVQGQALGGIFAASSNVVMLACGADDVSAAFYNFLIAVIFLISALIAFIVLTRTEFFQYYADESPNETTVVNEDTSNEKLIGDNAGDNGRIIPVRFFIFFLCT